MSPVGVVGAAATCVAGRGLRKSALAGACDFPLPFAGQVLRSTVHSHSLSFPSNSIIIIIITIIITIIIIIIIIITIILAVKL